MSCIFCRIVKGEIPSFKLIETTRSFAFFDIGPLSRGHALIIPKEHAEFAHQLSDESLSDVLPIAKRIAKAVGAENYNILQNNGKIAHQEVPHVHFHVIPKWKASDEEGLVIGWPAKPADMGDLKKLHQEIVEKISTEGLKNVL
ncbi:HIT-like protein [Ramicandelaber brevisporus]|nr:HIT-like protein [Ramicandelaber brevisporus]